VIERVLDLRIEQDRQGRFHARVAGHLVPVAAGSWSAMLEQTKLRIEAVEWHLNAPFDPSNPMHLTLLTEKTG
jgi:hypothetical protein